MGYAQSDLSNPKYGYDFVVATNQGAINATMKAFLSGLDAPAVSLCQYYDVNNVLQTTDLNGFQQLTTSSQYPDGVNPFDIPDGTPISDPRLQAISAVAFVCGFVAQIGLPPGYAPGALPDVVVLNPGSPGSALFSLMCSQFTVAQMSYNPRGTTWFSASQPDGNAWCFTSQINLASLVVGSTAYTKLPPAIQKQIDNLGAGAFSIQQLFFDLDNATLESIPTISSDIPSGSPLYLALQSVFLDTYFKQMQAGGQPVLGYTLSLNQGQDGTLTATSMSYEAGAYVDANGTPVLAPTIQEQHDQTFCYLCSTHSSTPPVPTQFAWNWLDLTEDSQYDGVMAINRNTFSNYLAGQIAPLLPSYSYLPHVHVYLSGFLDSTVNYEWSMTPGQTPTGQSVASGNNVYTYSWSSSSHDQAGAGGDMGEMKLSTTLNVTVVFQSNQIVITQHLVIYCYIESLSTGAGGNVVDKTITDTYTLAVDQNGQLAASLSSKTVDNSETPSRSGFLNFFTDINDLMSDVASWAQSFAGTSFTDLPLNIVQNFVFPGGSTFTFNDVTFSDNQDLVAHITYVQPGQ